jgi:hypothetical protein
MERTIVRPLCSVEGGQSNTTNLNDPHAGKTMRVEVLRLVFLCQGRDYPVPILSDDDPRGRKELTLVSFLSSFSTLMEVEASRPVVGSSKKRMLVGGKQGGKRKKYN